MAEYTQRCASGCGKYTDKTARGHRNMFGHVTEVIPMAVTRDARPIYQVAEEIVAEWRPVNYAAKPYLTAMLALDKTNDRHAQDIVLYFLANASSWRGEAARRIKAELGGML